MFAGAESKKTARSRRFSLSLLFNSEKNDSFADALVTQSAAIIAMLMKNFKADLFMDLPPCEIPPPVLSDRRGVI